MIRAPGSLVAAPLSRQQVAATAQGILAETWRPELASSGTQPATGDIWGSLIGLLAGDVVTGVLLRNATAAAGTLPTTARFGILDSTGKVLALSGNNNSLAAWALGPIPFAFTTPYTVLATGGFYACYIVNGTWGTTQPAPLEITSQGPALTAFGTAAPPNFQLTVQTDLPAVGSSVAITANSNRAYYMAFY